MTDKSNQTRDEVLRRMLKTPPTPHKPLGKRKKSQAGANKKGQTIRYGLPQQTIKPGE
jgi:hypothetical protein